jgi:hypothetical protein
MRAKVVEGGNSGSGADRRTGEQRDRILFAPPPRSRPCAVPAANRRGSADRGRCGPGHPPGRRRQTAMAGSPATRGRSSSKVGRVAPDHVLLAFQGPGEPGLIRGSSRSSVGRVPRSTRWLQIPGTSASAPWRTEIGLAHAQPDRELLGIPPVPPRTRPGPAAPVRQQGRTDRPAGSRRRRESGTGDPPGGCVRMFCSESSRLLPGEIRGSSAPSSVTRTKPVRHRAAMRSSRPSASQVDSSAKGDSAMKRRQRTSSEAESACAARAGLARRQRAPLYPGSYDAGIVVETFTELEREPGHSRRYVREIRLPIPVLQPQRRRQRRARPPGSAPWQSRGFALISERTRQPESRPARSLAIATSSRTQRAGHLGLLGQSRRAAPMVDCDAEACRRA